MSPRSFPLPHGATGIEIGGFVIEFCGDKVITISKDRAEHYTFHAGGSSGVLDIHRTWREADGTERHLTVFAMRHADIPSLLTDLASMTTRMFRFLRRLRPGWLYRHGIGIVRGLDPMTEAEMAAVTRRKPRRKRIVMDEEKLKANLRIPEYLDEMRDFPDGAFSLFEDGRKIGIGIKATDPLGQSRLYWFKLRDVTRFFRSSEAHFLATALKYAIPREKYAEFGILKP